MNKQIEKQVQNKTITLPDGRTLTLEAGKMAKQADGSVVLRMDNAMILATVVSAKEPKEGANFLPLTVNYQEQYAAAGRFPGGFFKREGRLSNYEITISRLIDRALRPLFPDNYHHDTQVLLTLISADKNVMPDNLAGLAASAALTLSDIPFSGPMSEVRVARINGEYIINPYIDQLNQADLDIIVAGTEDEINMVEGEMEEVSEAEMVEALKKAHESIRDQCKALKAFEEESGFTAKRNLEEPETTELEESVRSREMAALIGPYGAGKTHIMERVRTRVGDDVTWVDVRDMTPSGTSLNNVLNAIVLGLSDEPLRPNKEARSRQAERLMGRHYTKAKHPVIVIDDAHRLTEASLSGLKRLREAEFNGNSPLCSIILVGWERLGGKLHRRQDIAWRTSEYRLSEDEGYMTFQKRVAFMGSVFGHTVAGETRETIATLEDRPAGMVSTTLKAMERAYQAGYDVVDDRIVDPTPEQLKEALDVSYAEIADEAGVSKTTAHRRVTDPKDDPETDKVQAALDRIGASQPKKKAAAA